MQWGRLDTVLRGKIVKLNKKHSKSLFLFLSSGMPLPHLIQKTVLTCWLLTTPCLNVIVPKKWNFLAKAYDHAKHCYKFGFRMLTLGWSDGSTFLPVNSVLLSTKNEKNRISKQRKLIKKQLDISAVCLLLRNDHHAGTFKIG